MPPTQLQAIFLPSSVWWSSRRPSSLWLQVEHAVTEAITGLDLVELQLRVADGEPLGITQDDITFSGHAVEVRLCAEDAARDFMPQSGRMALWQIPTETLVEHALQSGSEIPPFYDSMIAKQGDRVEAGQPVMTLEAMKMEHVHVAPVSGIILAIDVVEAEQVTTGRIVAMIEAHQPA
jgi:acetyl/propionyl-CoA carboxylase alpha subunit